MNCIKVISMAILLSNSVYSQNLSIPGNNPIDSFLGIVTIDTCQFEDTCTYVVHDTSDGNIWQIGKPSKTLFDTAYSYQNAIVTDTINPYDSLNHSFFYFSVPTQLNQWRYSVIIGFKHKYQTDTLIDGGYIEISYDTGKSWRNVIHDDTILHLGMENMYDDEDSLMGGRNGFSGNSNGWIYSRMQWVWSVGVKRSWWDTVIVRFNFISDSIQTNKDGWIIDDIDLSYVLVPGFVKENYNNLFEVEVSPNPFHQFTTLKFDNPTNDIYSLSVYNTHGQVVKNINNIKTGKVILEKNKLSSGIYFFKLHTMEQVCASGKIIIK